jgi:hypothetical protein
MANRRGSGASEGRAQGAYTAFNPAVGVEQFMLIAVANADMQEMVSRMYSQLDSRVTAVGGQLSFTVEQFTKYNVTAFKARCAFVLRARWRSLGYERSDVDVRDSWAISTPIHDIISSIGTTRLGTAGVQVVPLWDVNADALVLSRQERDLMTPLIKSAMQQSGFPIHEQLSADMEGHHQVMVLTYLPAHEEWWVREPVGREDAAAGMVSGIVPVTDVERATQGPSYAIVDTERLATALSDLSIWVPELKMDRMTVVRYLTELADMSR